jgi:peptidoglycan/LPS O-acetylase OafA/YrhL
VNDELMRKTDNSVSGDRGAAALPLAEPTWSRQATSPLTQADSLALKAVAILAITLHNYYNWLTQGSFNEFDFDPRRVFAFIDALEDPRVAFQALCVYLGHFGVGVFIFLSAYGLALRYWDEPERHSVFLWGRIKKIYPAFALAIVCWVLGGFRHGLMGPVHKLCANWVGLLLTVLCISDFVPRYGLPPVGPWWFIPFIVQFYLIWPLLVRSVKRYGPNALLALSLAGLGLMYAVNPILVAHWSVNLLLCPLGHLPEICIGIGVARYRIRPGMLGTACAAVGFALSNFYWSTWLISSCCALILVLGAYRVAGRAMSQSRVLNYLGRRSMGVFLLNGFTRVPCLRAAAHWGTWYAGLLLGLVAVAAAIVCAEVLYRLEQALTQGKVRKYVLG